MVTAYSKSQVPLFLCDGKLTEYQLKSHDYLEGFSLLSFFPALPPVPLFRWGVLEGREPAAVRRFPRTSRKLGQWAFPWL